MNLNNLLKMVEALGDEVETELEVAKCSGRGVVENHKVMGNVSDSVGSLFLELLDEANDHLNVVGKALAQAVEIQRQAVAPASFHPKLVRD